jgi:hypothetical protein
MQMHYPAARKMCSPPLDHEACLRHDWERAEGDAATASHRTRLRAHGYSARVCTASRRRAYQTPKRLTSFLGGLQVPTSRRIILRIGIIFPRSAVSVKFDDAAIAGEFDDSVGSIRSLRSARNSTRVRSSSDPRKPAVSDHVRRQILGESLGHDGSFAIGSSWHNRAWL